jgi:dienelactone hydrolase
MNPSRTKLGFALVGASWLLVGQALSLNAQAPAKAKPGDAVFDKWLVRETERISRHFLDGATTREEWEARRPRLRQEFLDMLGLWPLPPRTPLQVQITGTLEKNGVVVEKLHFQSRPGLYVTGNLYRPKQADGKRPTILYVCGHSGRGRDGNKTAFQDHGMWFGGHGYVCLAIDTLQLGEIPGIHHGTYSHNRWWWQAAGYTPAGVECWNGMRAIDYLVSRPDVDASRIAVTGISGGGAYTMWISAADERVRCAVPVSGMSDLESYVSHKVINGHCDCMFAINTYQWEWTTIAALIAPRPLLFCNSDHDTIFPMDGNERIIARLRKLYRMYGEPELVGAHVSPGGHAYRPDLRLAIFGWINKHLKNHTAPVRDVEPGPFAGKDLRAFPEDKDLPKDAINGTIDETFVPRAKVHVPEPGTFPEWKERVLHELRARSFRPFPERIPAAVSLPNQRERKEVALTTEPGIEVVLHHRHEPLTADERTKKTGLLIVLNAGEETEKMPEWVKPYAADAAVVFLGPRGMGPTSYTRQSPPNYVERAHVLVGRTVDEGRVWDIAATLRFLDGETKGVMRWKVLGRGQAGILAAYAALFEPAAAELLLIDPPASHRDGPIVLNVLRVLDIPEALGLLAPKPLTLINPRGTAFNRTRRVYASANAEEQLKTGR